VTASGSTDGSGEPDPILSASFPSWPGLATVTAPPPPSSAGWVALTPQPSMKRGRMIEPAATRTLRCVREGMFHRSLSRDHAERRREADGRMKEEEILHFGHSGNS